MAQWELNDGVGQVGPLDEEHVIRMLHHGVPPQTVVRAVGETEWRNPRSHAPFAIALEQAMARAAQPVQDTAPPQPPPACSAAPLPAPAPVQAPPQAPTRGRRRVALGLAGSVVAVAILGVVARRGCGGSASTTSAVDAGVPYAPELPPDPADHFGTPIGHLNTDDGSPVGVFPTAAAFEGFLALNATKPGKDAITAYLLRNHVAMVESGTSVRALQQTPTWWEVAFFFDDKQVHGYVFPEMVKLNPAAPTVPTSVPLGTWAKIPRPGEDLRDTAENRIAYMANVMKVVPGEPKLNARAAKPLLERLRAEMAKQGSIPLADISVGVGESAANITVAKGKVGGLLIKGSPRYFGACSEALFASSIITAGLKPEDFAKVGVRGIFCKSDGCAAVFDMRPTSPGGGLYGGDNCLGLGEALTEELGK